MTVSIIFERGPETKHDVLVNVYCDGRRGTIAFPKETWKEIEDRGSIECFVASKADYFKVQETKMEKK